MPGAELIKMKTSQSLLLSSSQTNSFACKEILEHLRGRYYSRCKWQNGEGERQILSLQTLHSSGEIDNKKENTKYQK